MATTPLKKIQLKSSEAGITLEAQFNPESINLSKGCGTERDNQATENSPKLSFTGGEPFNMSLEIIFDTTETWGKAVAGGDVQALFVKPLLSLMKIGEYKDDDGKPETRPPHCQLIWGKDMTWNQGFSIMGKCFVEHANITFTLFDAKAKPLRAKASISLIEVAHQLKATNPTTLTETRRTWQVKGDETLDWIAYKEYGNSAMWRHIAEMNDIADPKKLRPGQLLRIVPL